MTADLLFYLALDLTEVPTLVKNERAVVDLFYIFNYLIERLPRFLDLALFSGDALR